MAAFWIDLWSCLKNEEARTSLIIAMTAPAATEAPSSVLLHPLAEAALRTAAEDAAASGKSECGWLVGARDGDSLVVLSAARRGEELEAAADKEELLTLLPAGLDALGVFCCGGGESAESAAAKAKWAKAEHLVAFLASASKPPAFLWQQEPGPGSAPIRPVPHSELPESWAATNLAMLRLQVTVLLPHNMPLLTASAAAAEDLVGVASAMVITPASDMPPSASQLLSLGPTAASAATTGTGTTVGAVAKASGAPASVACFLAPAAADGGGLQAAPAAVFCPAAGPSRPDEPARISLDVLCIAPISTPLPAAGAAIAAAARRQAAAAAAMLADDSSRPPRAVHFRPPQLGGGAATLLLPMSPGPMAPGPQAEAALQPLRARAHRRLGLPLDRPLLRLSNAMSLASTAADGGGGGSGGGGGGGSGARGGGVGEGGALEAAGGRLADVHYGLPRCPSGTRPQPGEQPALVQGQYYYYHYMQDRFDDAGWGCAYRSCQTLCSWFRCQHYSTAPVPTHGEIQALLVRMGDKEAAFAGSKQWIGAIELGFVLDELLGVSCKVMRFESGWDIPERARELCGHFWAEGTPVMVGGGMLAYTLLGLDFDEQTGEASFLILDPHYTGGEVLSAIQPRWCGWKKAKDVFDRNSFYNLLLPQRPREV